MKRIFNRQVSIARLKRFVADFTKCLPPHFLNDEQTALFLRAMIDNIAGSPDYTLDRTARFIAIHRKSFDVATIEKLVPIVGTFVGDCIIAKCGGYWKNVARKRALVVSPKLTVFPMETVRNCLERDIRYGFVTLYEAAQLLRPVRKIDRSFLPATCQEGGNQGLVAEFYEDGQLKTLRYYVDGEYKGHWHLRLNYGLESGCVDRAHISQCYRHGAYTTDIHVDFRDRQTKTPCDFVVWVIDWINKIATPPPVRRYISPELELIAKDFVLDLQDLYLYDEQDRSLTRQLQDKEKMLRQEEYKGYIWYYWRDSLGTWGCALVKKEKLEQWKSQGYMYVKLFDRNMWEWIANDSQT